MLSEAQLGKVVGLDVDVISGIARRLKRQPQIVPTAWFDLEAGLLARRYDVILSTWTPSPKTPATIVATVPYYEWGLLIACLADDKRIHSFADLDGLKVGHYRDPAVEQSLFSMGHGRFVAVDDPDKLFPALKSGALDALLFDSLYVRWRVATEPGFKVVGEPLNRLGYHVGVRKEDQALFQDVDGAVRELVSSEEMARIRKHWEGPSR
jgi:polar amino acid transport system substrate-binding protein